MTMSHPQYWATRPTSLFEQTQYEVDQAFYATFPAARDAEYNATLAQSIYEPPSPTDCPTSHEATHPSLQYDIRNELDISSTSVSFCGTTQELSYPQSRFDYSEALHPQQPFLPHHQSQPSYYSPPRPIENESPVYIPSNQPYHHKYSSEPTSQYIRQSHPSPVPTREPFQYIPQTSPSPVPTREPTFRYIPQTHPSPVLTREPAFLVYQSSNIPPQVNADIQETASDNHPNSPRYSFRQLNRHMKPPTLKFTNNCQIGVMRLDRLPDHNQPDSPTDSQSHPIPSETSHVSSCQTMPPPTEFLMKSAKSPSIGLSSLPSKNIPEKKPPLACLFCRGRKIACGPPLPGSIKKTCNQCRKRSLQCYYPTESRRGMRKKKSLDNTSEVKAKDTTTKIKRKRKSQK